MQNTAHAAARHAHDMHSACSMHVPQYPVVCIHHHRRHHHHHQQCSCQAQTVQQVQRAAACALSALICVPLLLLPLSSAGSACVWHMNLVLAGPAAACRQDSCCSILAACVPSAFYAEPLNLLAGHGFHCRRRMWRQQHSHLLTSSPHMSQGGGLLGGTACVPASGV
jgi:hypothetical protein